MMTRYAPHPLAVSIAMGVWRGTMWGALPDGAHPGLDSSKPLDASNMFSLALGISVGTRSGLDISLLLVFLVRVMVQAWVAQKLLNVTFNPFLPPLTKKFCGRRTPS